MLSFLYIGETLAICQADGITPDSIDFLNMMVRHRLISIDSYLSTLGEIWSSILHSNCVTPAVVISMSLMVRNSDVDIVYFFVDVIFGVDYPFTESKVELNI